jgi:uncharacterized damage-inducible protein DinB
MTSQGLRTAADQSLLEAVLDSWDRNNKILVNLLGMVPEGGLNARATESSPSVTQMFNHIHHVRLVFLEEDAPEFARKLPGKESADGWAAEQDRGRLAEMLNESAQAVRDAVQHKIATRSPMQLHYDHPLLFLQHMIWHEGYHHGQIKLALKLAGQLISNQEAGPGTWRVWMNKTK